MSIYSGTSLNHKEGAITPLAATCMDWRLLLLSEEPEGKRQTYGIAFKRSKRIEIDPQTENKLMVIRRKRGGEG